MVRRPSPTLACVLLATVASAAVIETTNSTTGVNYDGTIELQDSSGNNITTLVPLTGDATQRNSNGELFFTTSQNTGNISLQDLAYVSCDADPDVYVGGFISTFDVLKAIYNSGKTDTAILYSTSSDYCNYTATDGSLDQLAIYSTTNRTAAQLLKDDLMKQDEGTKFFARITRSGSDDSNTNGPGSQSDGQGQQNPLGPSPSTAVAMIILYSITGVITALFLVIIVTGAIRAHRHPDRYGPRDVMGRPRQSRARGLGMAILDTIPIVKFGEKEPPKPTDVELGSTSEARDVNAANAETTNVPNTDAESRREVTTDTPREANASAEHITGLDSGIAPAQGAAALVQMDGTASTDEGLGCSICTEDFEMGQDIRLLPCNHQFHPECVDPWLLNVSGTCPLCRVDLRPTTSHSSSSDPDAADGTLAPPLQSDPEPASRRHSNLRDVLSFRSRPNASADERISALRRLREQRRNQSREGVASANGSSDDVPASGTRSKRMSVRLSDVFGGRRRGENAGESAGDASARTQTQAPARDESPRRRDDDDTSAGAADPHAPPRT